MDSGCLLISKVSPRIQVTDQSYHDRKSFVHTWPCDGFSNLEFGVWVMLVLQLTWSVGLLGELQVLVSMGVS